MKRRKYGKIEMVHIVKTGESISGIAYKYGVSLENIYKANKKIRNRLVYGVVFVGEQIVIPRDR